MARPPKRNINDIKSQLAERLQESSTSFSQERLKKRLKENILLTVEHKEIEKLGLELQKAAKKHYKIPYGTKSRVKANIFSSLEKQLSWYQHLQGSLRFASKQVLASTLAVAVLYVSLMFPFASITKQFSTSTLASSLLLTCQGSVYINGKLCHLDETHELSQEDSVATSSGFASLQLIDNSIVRLGPYTDIEFIAETTGQNPELSIKHGQVWVNAQTSLSLRLPQLAVSVDHGTIALESEKAVRYRPKKNSTFVHRSELITVTASAQIQVPNQFKNQSTVESISPLTQAVYNNSFVQKTSVNADKLLKNSQWIARNQELDQYFYTSLKEGEARQTFTSSPLEYLAGIAAKVVSSPFVKKRPLEELDNSFKIMLSNAKKSNKAITVENIQDYQTKLLLLLSKESDSIHIDEKDIKKEKEEKNKLSELVSQHIRMSGFFTPGEEEYDTMIAFQTSLLQRVDELENLHLGVTWRSLFQGYLNNAFISLQTEKEEIAFSYLKSYRSLLETVERTNTGHQYMSTDNIRLLELIANNNSQLKTLSLNIKRNLLTLLKNNSQKQLQRNLSRISRKITGTAYQPL